MGDQELPITENVYFLEYVGLSYGAIPLPNHLKHFTINIITKITHLS